MPTRQQMRVQLEGTGFDVLDVRPFNVWIQPLHDHRLMAWLGRVRHRRNAGQDAASTGEPPLPRQTASGFQKAYAAVGLPLARLASAPDRLGALLGVGGSCSFVARKKA
jgi:hypothetical protein